MTSLTCSNCSSTPSSAARSTPATTSSSPDKKAELVVESVREFARPEYGVDLFKLETPLVAATLPEPGDSAAAREAASQFQAIGSICRQAGIPWVMLSGGAAPEQFERVLSYSYAAGAQGFLAGRTIWLQAIETFFPDLDKARAALRAEGHSRLLSLSALTSRLANPWRPVYEKSTAKAEGDFSKSYGAGA